MLLATPDTPLLQTCPIKHQPRKLNGQEQADLKEPLYSWPLSNYWETNFRAHQPGGIRARYWLLPHIGGFDEAAAHRFGMEAAHPPILQSLGEQQAAAAGLPEEAALLRLPEPPGPARWRLGRGAVARESASTASGDPKRPRR